MGDLNERLIIEAYNEGKSMNAIAKYFGTYAATVKRILEKNNIELRHDAKTQGSVYLNDGDKLIEWAKAQKRPVTKAELAEVAGRKRLSPSYFKKYPELGQYIVANDRKDLSDYTSQLYDYLQKHNIPYKPGDRTKLNVVVTALLLGEYSDIIIQIAERPYYISKPAHDVRIMKIQDRAEKAGIKTLFLYKEAFESDLEDLEHVLSDIKKLQH
jgi:hypothetical protein